MMMDIDVFAPSHQLARRLARSSVSSASPFDWWEQCKEKRVCGEHIDARARTSGTRSSRIVLAGTHSRHHANLEGCEPAA